MLTRRALLGAVVVARGMEAQRASQREAPPAEFSGFRIPKPGDIPSVVTRIRSAPVRKRSEAPTALERENVGVRIGRAFPPLTTRARISLGTMEEMQQATKVFAQALAVKAKAA